MAEKKHVIEYTDIIKAFEKVKEKLKNKSNKGHQHGNADITDIDASKIKSGTIDIDRLPKGAIERMVYVKDDAARFALTTNTAQNGDTVKVRSTKKMFYIIDDTKLSSEAGYEPYTAESASAVPWSGVTGKPTTFTPETHTHAISEVADLQETLTGLRQDVNAKPSKDTNTTYSLIQDSTDGHKLTFKGSDGSTKTVTIPDNDHNDNTWRDVVDGLDSTRTDASLSANQGRVLNGKFASYLPLHGTADIAASVMDYGNSAKQLQIGYGGSGITGDDIKYIAGYTSGDGGNISAKIKDISKDALKSWLGLGSRAYDSTNYLPLSGGTITGTLHVKPTTGSYTEGMRVYPYDGWSTIMLNGTDNTGTSGTSDKSWGLFNNDGQFYITKNGANTSPTAILSNTDGTWRANGHELITAGNIGSQNVNYANSAGSATLVSYTHDNEINFKGGTQSAMWFNYRNADTDAQSATTTMTYKFGNYNGSTASTVIEAARFAGKADNAGVADSSNLLAQNDTTASNAPGGLQWLNIAGGNQGCNVDVNDTPTNEWWYINRNRHTNQDNNYYTDVAIPFNHNSIYYKVVKAGSVANGGWVKVLDTLNYTDYCATAGHTHNYLPLSGGTITGKIVKNTNGSWVGDRDRAVVYSMYPGDDSYGCVAGMPTKYGSWTMGNLGGVEHLIFNYVPDANYNANKNESIHVYLRPTEGTIALTSDIPTSLPASDVYSWAKASSKPSYSWSEIGGRPTALSSFTNDRGFITGSDSRLTNARPASDVYSWAKASSKPSYTWTEISNKPDIPSISKYTPTRTNWTINSEYNCVVYRIGDFCLAVVAVTGTIYPRQWLPAAQLSKDFTPKIQSSIVVCSVSGSDHMECMVTKDGYIKMWWSGSSPATSANICVPYYMG